MKKHLYLICMALVTVGSTAAQEFTFHSNAPFSINPFSSGGFPIPQTISFYDYEGDGDQDLFFTALDYLDDVDPLEWEHVHFYIDIQENTGTKYAPQFAPRRRLSEFFPYPVGYFFAAPGDLDADGHADFMTAAHLDFAGNQKLRLIENTGIQGKDQFEIMTLEWMGLTDFVAESFFMPHLVDLDVDGDLDLLVSGFNPAFAEEDGPDESAIFYARNIGTTMEPNFQGWYANPYSLTPDTIPELMTSGDIDLDGDIDIIGALTDFPADSVSTIQVHINTPGPDQKPAFFEILKSPFGMPTTTGEQQLFSPVLTDLDGDGDLDLFVYNGATDNNVLEYYQNDLCQVTTTELAFTFCEGESFTYNGQTYTDPGVYEFHFTDVLRCDSIVHLALSVEPLATSFIDATICEGESYSVGNETFSAPGAYMVFVAGANGCDSIINLTLVVSPHTSFSVDATICAGETYTVGNEEFSVSGNYSVTLDAANGCDSVVQLTLEVHTVNTQVFANDIFLAAQETGATYQWIDCDSQQPVPGATQELFYPTVTGNYAVIITTPDGCTAQSTCVNFTITSTGDVVSSGLISFYPNPARDKVHVVNNSGKAIQHVAFITMTGRVIREFTIDSDKALDISGLPPGLYVVRVSGSGFSGSAKLVCY